MECDTYVFARYIKTFEPIFYVMAVAEITKYE